MRYVISGGTRWWEEKNNEHNKVIVKGTCNINWEKGKVVFPYVWGGEVFLQIAILSVIKYSVLNRKFYK